MAIPSYPLVNITPSDTFKEWADKCDDIITALEATDFITGDEGVTISGTQYITGLKIFNAGITLFGSGLNVYSANPTTFNGSGTLSINNANFVVTGTTQVKDEITFEKDAITETIGYPGGGTDRLTCSTILEAAQLSNSGATISLRGDDYTLPAAEPTVTSFLQSDNANVMSWYSLNDITNTVIGSLSAANFTLPTELIPIGTIIEVDEDAIADWTNQSSPPGPPYGESDDYPGWRVCDGETVSYNQLSSPPDVAYERLVRVLNETVGGAQTSGSVALPTISSSTRGTETTQFLIKSKTDSAVMFVVTGNDGITITPSNGTLGNQFDIEGGVIELNVDNTDFTFDSGALKLSNVATVATADTIAKRDGAGTLTGATPTADAHLATKLYVDSFDDGGNVAALVSSGNRSIAGGSTYSSLTLIDRKKAVRTWGVSDSYGRYGTSAALAGKSLSGGILPYSPAIDLTSHGSNVKEVFNIGDRGGQAGGTYFIDDDDVLYGCGGNLRGTLGLSFEGKTSNHGPPQPAMVPHSGWPEDYITVDTLSYCDIKTNVSGGATTNIMVKAIDSPTIYGKIVVAGKGTHGVLGNGNTSDTNYTNGPLVMSESGPGMNLWQDLGDGSAESFHYDIASTTEFYVKKFWRVGYNSYVIVGKKDNTAENELWGCGDGTYGQLGRGVRSGGWLHYVPLMKSTVTPLLIDSMTAGAKVYNTAGAHGLSNWDVIKHPVNGLYYNVVIGDEVGANTTTAFRLFYYDVDAYTASVSDGVVNGLAYTAGAGKTMDSYQDRLTGIVNAEFVVTPRSTTELTVLALADDKKLHALGFNQFGGTGLASEANSIYFATQTATGVDVVYGTNAYHAFILKNVSATSGDLYSCGYVEDGVVGYAGGAEVQRTWYQIPQFAAAGHFVSKIFVTGWSDYISETTHIGARIPAVFVVTKPITPGATRNKLWAAGCNRASSLGFTQDQPQFSPNGKNSSGVGYLADGLGNWIQMTYREVLFPEDPINITNVNHNWWQSFILCQTPGNEDRGRIYRAGGDYFKSGRYSGDAQLDRDPGQSYFTNWDKAVL